MEQKQVTYKTLRAGWDSKVIWNTVSISDFKYTNWIVSLFIPALQLLLSFHYISYKTQNPYYNSKVSIKSDSLIPPNSLPGVGDCQGSRTAHTVLYQESPSHSALLIPFGSHISVLSLKPTSSKTPPLTCHSELVSVPFPITFSQSIPNDSFFPLYRTHPVSNYNRIWTTSLSHTSTSSG